MNLNELKQMAWNGTKLPENAPISDQMYYMYMTLISDVYRIRKNKEECQRMQMKAAEIYNQYSLLERIANENRLRYQIIYNDIKHGSTPECPTCRRFMDALSGLRNYNWKEWESIEG